MMRFILIAVLSLAPSVASAQPLVKSSLPDPYGYSDYNEFRSVVNSGVRGKLVVGIPDKYVNTYTTHCRVPSGFSGLADGEYDCFEKDGEPVMLQTVKVAPKPKAATIPFENPTSVQSAGTTRSGSPEMVQYPVPTYTFVPSTVRRGITWTSPVDNCPPSG